MLIQIGLKLYLHTSTSSIATMTVFRHLFETHDIPELITSDDGTSFTSDEFKEFGMKNDIRHHNSAPYLL